MQRQGGKKVLPGAGRESNPYPGRPPGPGVPPCFGTRNPNAILRSYGSIQAGPGSSSNPKSNLNTVNRKQTQSSNLNRANDRPRGPNQNLLRRPGSGGASKRSNYSDFRRTRISEGRHMSDAPKAGAGSVPPAQAPTAAVAPAPADATQPPPPLAAAAEPAGEATPAVKLTEEEAKVHAELHGAHVEDHMHKTANFFHHGHKEGEWEYYVIGVGCVMAMALVVHSMSENFQQSADAEHHPRRGG
jgi:hypothetical protein